MDIIQTLEQTLQELVDFLFNSLWCLRLKSDQWW